MAVDKLHAPYAFVPLSAWVYEPNLPGEISHDVPLEGGFSGAAVIEAIAESPLLVGGRREYPNGASGPTVVRPFVLPDGRAAIPGSSLRGLIRNTLEIASFSRIGPRVDDKDYGASKHRTGSNQTVSTLLENTRKRTGARLSHAKRGAERLDMADRLFGLVGEEADERSGINPIPSLKGRVSFSAMVSDHKPDSTGSAFKVVLGEPKPGYYPTYLRQPGNPSSGEIAGGVAATYGRSPNNGEALVQRPEIAGWKQYPARSKAVGRTEMQLPKSAKVVSHLLPVPEGARFVGRVNFHNLLAVELGALLWSLTFGGGEGLCHRLGMGRPLGLGRIQLRVSDLQCEANFPAGKADADALTVASAIKAFRSHMNQAARTAFPNTPSATPWGDSAQVMSLLVMADPDFGDRANLSYMGFQQHNEGKALPRKLPGYLTQGGGEPGAGSAGPSAPEGWRKGQAVRTDGGEDGRVAESADKDAVEVLIDFGMNETELVLASQLTKL